METWYFNKILTTCAVIPTKSYATCRLQIAGTIMKIFSFIRTGVFCVHKSGFLMPGHNYDETFVLVIVYLFVFLPLTSFIAIKVGINKGIIQNTFKCNETRTTDPQGPKKFG